MTMVARPARARAERMLKESGSDVEFVWILKLG
jgi:hypothetical protein